MKHFIKKLLIYLVIINSSGKLSATDLVVIDEKPRSRINSSSSDEHSTSTESAEHNLETSQEVNRNKIDEQIIKDPLFSQLTEQECDGFKALDLSKYKDAVNCFGYDDHRYKTFWSYFMRGELDEQGPWKIISSSYISFMAALLKATDPFLIDLAQRGFDRMGIKFGLSGLQLTVKKISNPGLTQFPPYSSASQLITLSNVVNQYYCYLEMFQKISSDLPQDMVFTQFFKMVNFENYGMEAHKRTIWDVLIKHFPAHYLKYNELIQGKNHKSLSINIRDVKAVRQVDTQDPLINYFKEQPFVINGFNDIHHQNYDRALVSFSYHYYKDKNHPLALNYLSIYAEGEIYETGTDDFIPLSFDAAKNRYNWALTHTNDDCLKMLTQLALERLTCKQIIIFLMSQKIDLPRIKKTKPDQSMNGFDYDPKIIAQFIKRLLKTQSLIQLNEMLNMGDDFTYVDLLRLVMHPQFYESHLNRSLPIVWTILTTEHYDEFLKFALENNIQLAKPTPVTVIKKPLDSKTSNKTSWVPSFGWFFGQRTESPDTVPLLEDKKHI